MIQEDHPLWPEPPKGLVAKANRLLVQAHGHHMASPPRLARARSGYDRILEMLPNPKTPEERHVHAEALHKLGGVNILENKFGTALDLISAAVRISPTQAIYQNDLGLACLKLGLLKHAVKHFRFATIFGPTTGLFHYNLAGAHARDGNTKEAQASYARALTLEPNNVDFLVNMGTTYHAQEMLDDALAYYQRAAEIDPKESQAHYNIGVVNHDRGKYKDAIQYYERALAINPDYIMVHWNYGMALLATGDFKRGFDEYEWRWRMKEAEQMQDVAIPGLRFNRPFWNGESNVRVHLHHEQGLGDQIQFARYAPMVAALGNSVTLELHPSLVELFQYSMPGINGISSAPDYPGAMGVPPMDYQLPLMSLPRAFKTTVETIPWDGPYLKADPAKVAEWKPLITGDFKVGVVWSSGIRENANPLVTRVGHRKSTRLRDWWPLSNRDVSFYSIQLGPPAEELKDAPFPIVDFTDRIHSFADTAAMVECLDLVICVDTAVGHLAGAMGKPVFLLELFDSCWRWLDREDSPWYPNHRIIRQAKLNEWGGAFEQVADTLRGVVSCTD